MYYNQKCIRTTNRIIIITLELVDKNVASSYVHGMEQRLKYGITTLRLPKRVPAEAFQGLKVAVLVVLSAHWHSAINGADAYGCPTRET
jgi:Pyruvate/2-oxoacid:ferredoxin oxidoreductase gamma subunit